MPEPTSLPLSWPGLIWLSIKLLKSLSVALDGRIKGAMTLQFGARMFSKAITFQKTEREQWA
jgi:hypothetical protein